MNTPKVFISYSWSSPEYKEQVLNIADRLINDDGIDVIIDEYDLQGGQDVISFMEQLKTDESITHVLVLCDQKYCSKANSRTRGVGTEAQIISPDVYEDIGQTRVLPIVMERDSEGDPCLPTFLKSRVYFDFSSTQSMNRDWEKLGRHLWGRPIRTKPKLGDAPAYLSETTSTNFAGTKRSWQQLYSALLDGKPSVPIYREELLDNFEAEMNEAANSLTGNEHRSEILPYWENCLGLQKEAQEILLNWILAESRVAPEKSVHSCLIPCLERINSIPDPDKVQGMFASPFSDSMAIFGYEMALYSVAALIRVDSPGALKSLLEHPFVDRDRYNDGAHAGLSRFCHYSELANTWNQSQKEKWISPVFQLMIDRTTNPKLNTQHLVEAEALIFLVNILHGRLWYPYSAVYAERGTRFPWFVKAKNERDPDRLAIIADRDSWQTVRDEFVHKFREEIQKSRYEVFSIGRGSSFLNLLSMGGDCF